MTYKFKMSMYTQRGSWKLSHEPWHKVTVSENSVNVSEGELRGANCHGDRHLRKLLRLSYLVGSLLLSLPEMPSDSEQWLETGAKRTRKTWPCERLLLWDDIAGSHMIPAQEETRCTQEHREKGANIFQRRPSYQTSAFTEVISQKNSGCRWRADNCSALFLFKKFLRTNNSHWVTELKKKKGGI